MAENHEERLRCANDEILTRGDLDALDRVFAEDYVVHTGGKDHTGRAFVRRFVTQLRAALPDLRVVEVELLSRSGDTVTWQRRLRGTHEATLSGIPPSGKRVEWRDMLVSRFAGAKIAEEWAVSELAGELLLKQPRRK